MGQVEAGRGLGMHNMAACNSGVQGDTGQRAAMFSVMNAEFGSDRLFCMRI